MGIVDLFKETQFENVENIESPLYFGDLKDHINPQWKIFKLSNALYLNGNDLSNINVHRKHGLSEYFLENEKEMIDDRDFFYNTYYKEIVGNISIELKSPLPKRSINFNILFNKKIKTETIEIESYGAHPILFKDINMPSIDIIKNTDSHFYIYSSLSNQILRYKNDGNINEFEKLNYINDGDVVSYTSFYKNIIASVINGRIYTNLIFNDNDDLNVIDDVILLTDDETIIPPETQIYKFYDSTNIIHVYCGESFIIILTFEYKFFVYGIYNDILYKTPNELLFSNDVEIKKTIMNNFKPNNIANIENEIYNTIIVKYDFFVFDDNNNIFMCNFDNGIYVNNTNLLNKEFQILPELYGISFEIVNIETSKTNILITLETIETIDESKKLLVYGIGYNNNNQIDKSSINQLYNWTILDLEYSFESDNNLTNYSNIIEKGILYAGNGYTVFFEENKVLILYNNNPLKQHYIYDLVEEYKKSKINMYSDGTKYTKLYLKQFMDNNVNSNNIYKNMIPLKIQDDIIYDTDIIYPSINSLNMNVYCKKIIVNQTLFAILYDNGILIYTNNYQIKNNYKRKEIYQI